MLSTLDDLFTSRFFELLVARADERQPAAPDEPRGLIQLQPNSISAPWSLARAIDAIRQAADELKLGPSLAQGCG